MGIRSQCISNVHPPFLLLLNYLYMTVCSGEFRLLICFLPAFPPSLPTSKTRPVRKYILVMPQMKLVSQSQAHLAPVSHLHAVWEVRIAAFTSTLVSSSPSPPLPRFPLLCNMEAMALQARDHTTNYDKTPNPDRAGFGTTRNACAENSAQTHIRGASSFH